jgi:adenylosuccinate synthase
MGLDASRLTVVSRARARDVSFVGGLYGDEAKGATVIGYASQLPEGSYVGVKHAGGAQAAHRGVYKGKAFTFSQLSAAACLGADTIITQDFVVDLEALGNELDAFHKVFGWHPTIYINSFSPRVTRHGREMAQETERKLQHGTTGRGVGQARLGGVKVGSILTEPKAPGAFVLRRPNVHLYTRETFPNVSGKTLLYEASQGVGLDQDHGFFPNVTRSTVTHKRADELAKEFKRDLPLRVVCLRTYSTRHGNGPLMCEYPADHPLCWDPDNTTGTWQGRFRAGPLDMVVLRYTLGVLGHTDFLSVSCMDRCDPKSLIQEYSAPILHQGNMDLGYREMATKRQTTAKPTVRLVRGSVLDELRRLAPIGMVGYGPSPEDRESAWAMRRFT